MEFKIFFDDKPLYLISSLTPEIEQYIQHPYVFFTEDISSENIKTTINQMLSTTNRAGVFLHGDINELLDAIKKELVLIQAAGGFIYTNNNYVLLIYRRGKWDLPKGKLDEGEDLAECAIREVGEETGLTEITLAGELCITYHTYLLENQHILKESHWYLMTGNSNEKLEAQFEEGIEKCEWVFIDDLPPYIEKAHASIKDVIDKGMEAIALIDRF